MLRGFLSGIIWGGIVVLIVVGAASLLAPLPATVTPQTSAVQGTAGATEPETAGALEGTSRADAAVDGPAKPDAAAPAEGEAPPLADTDPAPRPETGGPEADLNAPENPDEGGAVRVVGDSPVLPNPQAETPDAPDAEEDPSISTNPPQPQVPEVVEEEAFPTPQPAEDSAETADLTPEAEAGAPPPEPEDAPVMKPAGDLDKAFPQRKSERLPTIAGDGAQAEPTATQAPVLRPVLANAEPLENPEGKPIMAIVLVDLGDGGVDLDALSAFPYPLSIAISTLDPQASEKAAQYRARGFEVLAMIEIPGAAAPADVEVAMAAHLSVMPEAVAVIEGLGDGLQGSKPVSDQVSEVLAQAGYGLLMLPNGLNTAQKLAAKAGVPSATVFRDFDSKGQSEVVMRRFLDQAAFKAGQEDGVVMLGRLRAETVSALLLWGLQDRASDVALVPISAVLLREE